MAGGMSATITTPMRATRRLEAIPTRRSADKGHAAQVEEERLRWAERKVGPLEHALDLDQQTSAVGEPTRRVYGSLQERGLGHRLALAVPPIVLVELGIGPGHEALRVRLQRLVEVALVAKNELPMRNTAISTAIATTARATISPADDRKKAGPDGSDTVCGRREAAPSCELPATNSADAVSLPTVSSIGTGPDSASDA